MIYLDIVTDGLEHDGGKLRLSLVPAEAIEAIGAVMTHGAEKYGKDTYKQVEPERYRDALMRHVCKWLKDPHGKDEYSGLPHIWHIITNAAFLCELDVDNSQKMVTPCVVTHSNIPFTKEERERFKKRIAEQLLDVDVDDSQEMGKPDTAAHCNISLAEEELKTLKHILTQQALDMGHLMTNIWEPDKEE